MIGGESTEKSLADLRQEFEQMLGVLEQQDVQKIMLDVTRGGLSVADAENASKTLHDEAHDNPSCCFRGREENMLRFYYCPLHGRRGLGLGWLSQRTRSRFLKLYTSALNYPGLSTATSESSKINGRPFLWPPGL